MRVGIDDAPTITADDVPQKAAAACTISHYTRIDRTDERANRQGDRVYTHIPTAAGTIEGLISESQQLEKPDGVNCYTFAVYLWHTWKLGLVSVSLCSRNEVGTGGGGGVPARARQWAQVLK
jgi:hypothetical protein